MQKALIRVGIIIMAVVIGGCASHSTPAWLSLNPAKWANRDDAGDPLVFDVSGPLAVDVESFNGDVQVVASPKAVKATVRLVKEGVQGYGRSKEAANSLEDISASAEIVPGDMGQMLQVRTSTTNSEPHFQRAHVIIEAPQIEGVSIHTHHGQVFCRSISGAVDISTDGADVRVMTNLAMTKPVTIVNKNGSIDYRVRGESTGLLDCETIDGRALHHIRFGKVRIRASTDKDSLHATLNDGTNPIRLRTVKGDIRVAVVHNPEEVGEHNWVGW